MENDRNNDELIRSKLDSYSVEPGKLTFTKLEAGYKASGASGGIVTAKALIISAGISIAVISTLLVIFNPFKNTTNSQKAALIQSQNTQNNKTDSLALQTAQQEIISAASEEIAGDNSDKANASKEIQSFIKEQPDPANSHENKIVSENGSSNNEKETAKQAQKENDPHFNNANETKKTANNAAATTHSKNDVSNALNTAEKTNSRVENKKTSGSKKEPKEPGRKNIASQKTTGSKPVEKNTTQIDKQQNGSEQNPEAVTGTKELVKNRSKKTAIAPSQKNKAENNNPLNASAKNNKQDETVLNESKAGQNIETVKPQENNPQENYLNAKKLTLPILIPEEKEVEINSQLSGAPENEVAPKDKKWHFYLSTELNYNTLKYRVDENTNYNKESFPDTTNTYSKKFAEGHSGTKNNLLSGSLLGTLAFKNLGLSAGISYLNIETQTNTENLFSTGTRTVIDHFLKDTLGNIYDTVYKTTSYKRGITVNGDSVSKNTYLNSIRFVTIPLNFSYSFKLDKGKFVLEPHAGILIGIPLPSYQLATTDGYSFEYKKTKTGFRNRSLYFDLSLQVKYRITPSALFYIKQGYSFGNQSIYKDDYLIKLSPKNVYTSVGVTILIR